jgi:GH15 family glucan-1,4-alpha-glucosidase
MARSCIAAFVSAALVLSADARAEVPVQTTLRYVPSANGHGALLLDLKTARLTHFREHMFASEEPLLDASGKELWNGNQPLSVPTRDLLFDAYFGLRSGGKQAWLTSDAVKIDKSGYVEHVAGAVGGTGVVRMVQSRGALEITQYFFCPMGLQHAGFVMVATIKNIGASEETGVSLFSLHNFHLGFGRPGALADVGENGETASYSTNNQELLERGFAGVIVGRPLAAPTHHAGSWGGAPSDQNLFAIVDSGSGNFPDLTGEAPGHDGTVTGFQWDVGTLAPQAEKWLGVVFAHHGDPFAAAQVQSWLDAFVKGRSAQQIIVDEIAQWKQIQAGLKVPSSLDPKHEALYRQSAAMLSMAQVTESTSFLREWLTKDGEKRYTRFGDKPSAPPAQLPATIAHRGSGAILASLPPGEWTVAWLRDGAYAAAALAEMGAPGAARARQALQFYLGAEGGRFQKWQELAPYGMPPYRLSLVRYHGFGVEETDFNDFGPNLEFDGFGLFLWSLRRYHRATQDAAFVNDNWPAVKSEIADVIVALIEKDSGLLRPDSSIWETHWKGRERHWAYTNITAARGLCDAADLAALAGDTSSEAKYRAAGIALRKAIATKLTDADGAIASNSEELASGSGYWDAAVLDAIALELFDPKGKIAKATIAGLDKNLRVPAGAGWARNDDRFDHAGKADLSPWGSEYDSGEWVFVDMRGAVAASLMGDAERANRLTKWVRDQASANYLEIGEVFDEGKGTYKFNSPMIGFGAGAYALALQQLGNKPDPACGAYHEEGGGGAGGAGGASGDTARGEGKSGCSCELAGPGSLGGRSVLAALVVVGLARRRARRGVGMVRM